MSEPSTSVVLIKAAETIERLTQQRDALIRFARDMILEAFDGCDVDGGTIQDVAEREGLLIRTTYDPAVHKEVGDVEAGDEWFVVADWMKDAAS